MVTLNEQDGKNMTDAAHKQDVVSVTIRIDFAFDIQALRRWYEKYVRLADIQKLTKFSWC